jgi:hypothetical protein
MVKTLTPEEHGSGWWTFLHTASIYDPMLYAQSIEFTRRHFFCDKCRQEFQREITAVPLTNYRPTDLNRIDDIDNYAHHGFNLHNRVSQRLGKRQISWDEFKKIHVKGTPGAEVCESCRLDQPQPSNTGRSINRQNATVTPSPRNISRRLVTQKPQYTATDLKPIDTFGRLNQTYPLNQDLRFDARYLKIAK